MGLRFEYEKGQLEGRADVLCVDGVFDCGRNLSHWPGHRTPPHLRHDLSTGICLNLAADPGRAQFLRGVEIVANNHYDTDGLCSLFAALEPEAALSLKAPLLRAAAAGDLEQVENSNALAFDCIVSELSHHLRSPLIEEVEGLDDDRRHEVCYRWLLERVPEILTEPETHAEMWRETVRGFEEEMATFEGGESNVEWRPVSKIALIRSARPLHTHALVTAANRRCDGGRLFGRVARILSVVGTPSGTLYRFIHATHSWFDFVTPIPRRFELAEVARTLQSKEEADGRWVAATVDVPLCDLVFGRPTQRESVLDSAGEALFSALPERVVLEIIEAAATPPRPS